MATPSMSYRRLDSNGDYTFGNGLGNFLTGRYAVAQAISTKLKLLMGEWSFNTQDGLPFFQSIAGYAGKNKTAVDRIIASRILDVPNVNSILNISSTYTSSTRTYAFTCWANTAFGVLVVTNIPPVDTAQQSTGSQVLIQDSSGSEIIDSSGNYIIDP